MGEVNSSFFDRLVWKDDRVILGDLVFRFEDSKSGTWELVENCFRLWKSKSLMDQYQYYSLKRNFQPKNILELGTWDGGSLFWGSE